MLEALADPSHVLVLGRLALEALELLTMLGALTRALVVGLLLRGEAEVVGRLFRGLGRAEVVANRFSEALAPTHQNPHLYGRETRRA